MKMFLLNSSKMTQKCLVFVTVIVNYTLGLGLPSTDQYLFGIQKLVPSFNKVNAFEGPSIISGARISTPVKITKPTRDEMKYYSYYIGSANCGIGVKTMVCGYCRYIKDDIKDFVVLTNSSHETLALVALSEKRKEIVVAFRATLNYWNVILDAAIVQISTHGSDGVKIHKGFYIAVMSLYDSVVKTVGAFRLSKKEYASYKLVITGKTIGQKKLESPVDDFLNLFFQGHSLGAAMARVTQYFLLQLKQFPGIQMEVYTYGEPRCGNKHFVDFLNKQNMKTARIVNRADLVSHIPPVSMLGTTIVTTDYYYHVQNEYWIDGDREKFADRSVYEDASNANSYGPLYSGLDHFQYFDVNNLRCASDVPQLLAIPDVFQPTDVIPPFPEPIQVVLRDVGDLTMRIGAPLG